LCLTVAGDFLKDDMILWGTKLNKYINLLVITKTYASTLLGIMKKFVD